MTKSEFNPQQRTCCGFFFNPNSPSQLAQRLLFILFIVCHNLNAQNSASSFLRPADSLVKKRVFLAGGFSALSYTGFSAGLYFAWYRNQNLGKFRQFNDWNEWRHMDKMGHLYNGFFQSDLIYQGARWTGMNKRHALLYGVGISMLFQSTIELYDGFSPKWGFSWPDMAANGIGGGLFVVQEALWNDQKFYLKFSSYPIKYSRQPVLHPRADELFGTSLGERLLKDYNAQTYWLSFNPVHWSGTSKKYWPMFLNIALGYGANNLYGGYRNEWVEKDGTFRKLDALEYPRYAQYLLSLDIDLRKIPVKNPYLRSVFRILNIFKFPFPALEFNSLGKLKGHWLYF